MWKKIGKEQALKLGLLMNADEDVEDCDWLTLQHKMLQVSPQNTGIHGLHCIRATCVLTF